MTKAIITREVLQNISNNVKAKWNPTVDDIINLVDAKNHDYGDAWQRYGIFTPLIRINDKTLRLKTLSTGEQALVADENVQDTLRDIIGYSLLALEYLRINGGMALAYQPELFPEEKLKLISNIAEESEEDELEGFGQ